MRLNPGDIIKSVHTDNAFVVEYVSADGHCFILQPRGKENSRSYNMHDFNRSFVRVSESDTFQTGNSPVIGIDMASEPDRSVEVRYLAPPGYVMVPKMVTPEIGNAINEVGQRCTCGNCSQRLWDLLLASAPVQVDIEILASALKNAPLAPSDNQGRPRAPVVPAAIEPDYKVIKSILPTANPDEYACCIAADMWNACRAAMLQAGNHTEQHLDMVDHSGDANEKGSDGTFIDEGTKQACNSPVILEGWISCSERMPEQGAYISAVSKHGEYVAGQVIDDWLDLHDGTSFGLDEVYLWMMLPPLPASPQQ